MAVQGCTTQSWNTNTLPDEQQIHAMLNGEAINQDSWQLSQHHYPQFRVPQNVRPCCAFGDMQKVNVGAVPVPFFRLDNLRAREDVGPHKFASGIYHFTPASASALNQAGGENNGLMYTRRGGFIDLAHVRDTADDTIALFFDILAHLGKAHRIELPSELGPRYIELKAFDTSALTAEQRWQIAAHVAARLAYFKAESHEIAQWHGYSSFTAWPETISAYSIEDLYSNMLGAKLVLALIQQRKILSEEDYNRNLTLWLDASLRQLDAVDKTQARMALDAVDGIWWDSQESIPSKYMVLKRHYLLGDTQRPYLAKSQVSEVTDFPVILSLPSRLYDLELDKIAVLVLEINSKYRSSFSHIPDNLWRKRITHLTFRDIAAYDEKEDQKELARLGLRSGPEE
ncbi:DUF4056 domain-containing protein [Photobacterium ganghwense]|uniref:DUF4056 domain-containing protein n=2 Tax=Photobacterium TaxID=657 RepID=UPI0020C2FC91|nr:DUF4056 domain-containing protein [Photobacterium ganghwense]